MVRPVTVLCAAPPGRYSHDGTDHQSCCLAVQCTALLRTFGPRGAFSQVCGLGFERGWEYQAMLDSLKG